MIRVENLTRRFAGVTALDSISFEVRRGEIVGFLGPNGAGKTTTMRVLTGYLAPTSGRVSVAGLDVLLDSREVRQKIGYLPENVAIYPEMRIIEYLRYRGRLKGLHGRKLRSRIDDVVSSCGLGDVRRKVVGTLSKGYRQRVGLADSLLHEPEVVILDEPTIGLDPNQIRMVRNLVKGLAPRHTVLLSSHILPEVETVCERVLIINRGRIVASDTPGSLVGLLKGNMHVSVEIQGPTDTVKTELETIPGVVKVTYMAHDVWGPYVCECAKGRDIRTEIFRAVAARGWVMRELRSERQNLEDVFVAMTAEDIQPSQAGNGAAGGEHGKEVAA